MKRIQKVLKFADLCHLQHLKELVVVHHCDPEITKLLQNNEASRSANTFCTVLHWAKNYDQDLLGFKRNVD